jgi:hypothetical protein
LLLEDSQINTLLKYEVRFEVGSVDADEETDCPICLQKIYLKDYKIFLCGRHFGHVDCFDGWL